MASDHSTPTPRFRNLYACLVHEKPECILDLVRNLRHLDPGSEILLYNGSEDPGLMKNFHFERYGVFFHPRPRPLKWGLLHDFGFDCMRHALEHLPFDTLTIVDSDQLAIGRNYSEFLGAYLTDKPQVGLLSSAPAQQSWNSQIPPVVTINEEFQLWQPFVERFADWQSKWMHWTFWPGTVITRSAAVRLVEFYDQDLQLRQLIAQSKIWASEEILFPTLTRLLGFEVAGHGSNMDYVQYRSHYSSWQVDQALTHPSTYFIHPIPREDNHPLRKQIRDHFERYPSAPEALPGRQVELAWEKPIWPRASILEEMEKVQGWLSVSEAELLMIGVERSLNLDQGEVLEIGSYCGKSTLVIARVLQQSGAAHQLHALDPHLGVVGSSDTHLESTFATWDAFRQTIHQAGLDDWVVPIRAESTQVEWTRPIRFLMIDALHDYFHVAQDLFHFEHCLVPGAWVAFHDYSDYYPGIKVFVDELVASGHYTMRSVQDSLALLQFQYMHQEGSTNGPTPAANPAANASVTSTSQASIHASVHPHVDPSTHLPVNLSAHPPARQLVSCIMPTADRPGCMARSLDYWLRQDYPQKELLILDNGVHSVKNLVPKHAGIRYFRMSPGLSVGTLRNRLCQEAKGEIIVHWDDDDWAAPTWLSTQVEALKQSQADVTGLDRLFFYAPLEEKAWCYVYPAGHPAWVHGATMCYWKSSWEAAPFPDEQVGEDCLFQWDRVNRKVIAHSANQLHVSIVHGRNTSPKHTEDPRWEPIPVRLIHELLGRDRSGLDAPHSATDKAS